MSNLLIRNVRIMDGDAADIRIRDGVIADIAPELEPGDAETVDGGGHIAIPALVDAHTHLDKSLLGLPWYKNDVGGGSLIGMIENERRIKRALDYDAHVQSMRHALRTVAYGGTMIRSHVDIDTEGGLRALEGVQQTAEKLAQVVEIETVAFPQSGLMIREGTAELMDRALEMGAHLVGGLDPCAVDRDPKGHLDTIFALAEKHGKGIDIHLHEGGEMGLFSMDMILERTEALDMKGMVTISHAFCLGMPDFRRVDAMLGRLAALDVAIMTTAPSSSPAPLVRELDARGIRIGAGNDGFQDTWGPYGNGDMLERAKVVGQRNNLRMDSEVKRALDICTGGGAVAMGKPRFALETGAPGDLVLVSGDTVVQSVVSHAPRKLVVKAGRVVARDGKTLIDAP
ncbi:cytosine deaminase [Sulfitobacter alexandrii]|uniref:Cytosine deaminase n=1 Tax=Sulfitobacter alexandrii TaxID=1917485 RepID=A0A1J0WLN1_9RHOB|nr:amidohydrolase family protein [Sulfitobacter alexandrii]APE45197.1 cytosine deaminase [Sulfitobacter alexandrii]